MGRRLFAAVAVFVMTLTAVAVSPVSAVPPNDPGGVTAALNATLDGVDATWTAPVGGDPVADYTVELLDAVPAVVDTATVVVPGLTHSFTGVAPGTYTVRVRANNIDGPSGDVDSAPVVVPDVPATPAAPTAALSGTNDIQVTWVAPADGGSPITGYDVTLTASAGGPAPGTVTVAAGTLSFLFAGVPVGTYTATVVATNAVGNSAASPASAPVTIPGPPDQVSPAPVATAVLPDGIDVTWTTPADNGSPITGYTVVATEAGLVTTSLPVGPGATSASFTSLPPGIYTVTVEATNALGNGPVSAASNQVALGNVPGPPTGVSGANPTANSIEVSFTAPTNNGGSPITGYTVTATGGGGSVTVNNVTTSPVLVTGLSSGTSYTFIVTANNAFGGTDSASSSPVTTIGVPGAPTGVAASLVPATSATVSFTAPASDGGSPITGYTVTATPAGGGAAIQASGSTSPIEVSGLSLGETYTFTVSAGNAVGSGAGSASSAPLLVPDVPVTPCCVTAENQTPFSSTVTITWGPPADDGGSPIVDYTVTLGGQTQTVAAAADLSVTFNSVPAGVYTPTVTARNAGSTSGEATGPEVEVRGFPPFGSEEAFIEQLYLDFLGRQADQAGLDYWTGITNDDGSNIDEIVRSFMFSAEFNPRRAITRLYLAFFDRAPDLGGFDYWAGQINSGQANLDTISQSFVMSPEFVSTYGSLSDRDFIRLVYNNVLVRQPDQAGYDFWLNEMANGMTRGQLMTQFSESPEFVQNTRPAVDVIVTYRGMLDRVPDSSGFSFWLGQIANDQNAVLSLIVGFYNSPEYAGRIIP